MRLVYRLLIAIPLALLFMWGGIKMYQVTFAVSGMAAYSCMGTPGPWWWMYYVWPFVLAVGIFTPSLLILANVKWYKVLIALVVVPLISGACLLIWYPILLVTCSGSGV